MKKLIISMIILFIIIIVLIITLLFKTNSGTIKCIYTSNNDVMKSSSIYIIKYNNRVVDSLYTKETLTIGDKKSLDEYREKLLYTYSKYDGLKYYDNSIKLKDNTITSITNINYKRLDRNKFISIDKNNGKLFTNGSVRVNTLVNIYKDMGAKCSF